MGPFELGDLTGIDVNFPAANIIYNGYMQDPRIKTAPVHEAMYNSGRWGRKTSAGWYDYKDGKVHNPPSPDHETDARPASHVSLAEPSDALADLCQSLGIEVREEDDGSAPVLAAPVGDDATHTALMTDADFKRLVCIDLSCDTSKRVCIMTAPGADPAVRDAVAAAESLVPPQNPTGAPTNHRARDNADLTESGEVKHVQDDPGPQRS